MVDDLQKDRPAGLRDASQRPRNQVVDVAGQNLRRDGSRHVGVENFEEMAEALALGFFAELFVAVQRIEIAVDVVDERDRVEPQIGSAGAGFRAQLSWPHCIWSMAAERNGRAGSRWVRPPRGRWTSLASLARAAGVTWEFSNSPSSMAS